MNEKIASGATAAALWTLTTLLALHGLLIFPGWARISRAGHALAAWASSHEIKAADYIAIVSALATVGAVVAALWLARTDRRRIAKESTARAQLAAASIAARLTLTLEWVSGAVGYGFFPDRTLPPSLVYVKELARMSAEVRKPVFRPDAEVLLNLTPLPKSTSHRIARAYDLIESVRWQVEAIPQGKINEKTSASERQALLERWLQTLLAARDLLRVALVECHVATELGAPMPTGYELHGEPDDDWDS